MNVFEAMPSVARLGGELEKQIEVRALQTLSHPWLFQEQIILLLREPRADVGCGSVVLLTEELHVAPGGPCACGSEGTGLCLSSDLRPGEISSPGGL